MLTFRDDPKLGSKVPMIKTADLNEQCVTNSKILNGCITKEKLAKGTVDATTLANKSVGTEKLSDSSVTNEKISNKAVSTEKLADGSITKEKIFNASITTEKLANESVSAEKLQSGLRNTIASTYDKTIELDNQKANITDVGNAIERLENKIGERFIVEGDVTNLPDEEDLTSVSTIDGREVMKLNDRAYEPSNFSGKGYKILRKNIKLFDIPIVNIVVSYAPTSSGDISITVNDKVTTIHLDSTTDTTPAIVATKIGDTLKSSLNDYDVSLSSNRIVLARKKASSVLPSSINIGNTSANISVTDGINKNVRKNILTKNMIKDPNTIYEIRYNFDLNNGYIALEKGVQLLFRGGMLSNGTIVFNEDSTVISEQQCFDTNITIGSTELYRNTVLSCIKAKWFGAKADCNKFKLEAESTDNYIYLQKAIDTANSLRAPLILERGCYRISQSLNVPSNSIIIGESSAYNWIIDNEKYSNDTLRQTEILLDSTTHNIVFNVKNQSTFKNLKIDGWRTKNVIAFYTKDFALNKSLFENLKICRCKCAFSINPAANQGFSASTLKDINIYKCDAGILFNGEGKANTYITATVFNKVLFNFCKDYCVNFITESNISDLSFTDCEVEYLNTGEDFSLESYKQYGCHAFIFNSKGWQGVINIDSCYIEGVIPFKEQDNLNVLHENCSVENISCIVFSNTTLSITNTRFANNLVLVDMRGKTQLHMDNCISDDTNVYKDGVLINTGLLRKKGTDISQVSIDLINLKNKFKPFEGDSTYVRANIRNVKVDNTPYKDFIYNDNEPIDIYVSQNGSGNGLSHDCPMSFSAINDKKFISDKVTIILLEDITITSKIAIIPSSVVLDLNGHTILFSNKLDNLYYISIKNVEEITVKNGTIDLASTANNQTLFSFGDVYYSGKSILYSNLSFINVNKAIYLVSQTKALKHSFFLSFYNIKNSGTDSVVIATSTVDARDFKTYCKKEVFTGFNVGSLILLSENNNYTEKGPTSKRPVLNNTNMGYMYYDTTLKKYIVWNSTEWTNMDGTALS